MVPAFAGQEPRTFVGIKSGDVVDEGAVSYLGKPVSATELAERAAGPEPGATVISLMERYVTLLQGFKIGNVLRLQYGEGGQFELIRVANSPPPLHPPRLP